MHMALSAGLKAGLSSVMRSTASPLAVGAMRVVGGGVQVSGRRGMAQWSKELEKDQVYRPANEIIQHDVIERELEATKAAAKDPATVQAILKAAAERSFLTDYNPGCNVPNCNPDFTLPALRLCFVCASFVAVEYFPPVGQRVAISLNRVHPPIYCACRASVTIVIGTRWELGTGRSKTARSHMLMVLPKRDEGVEWSVGPDSTDGQTESQSTGLG
eukprot:6231577-Pyramimonas_sp.AAC.1